jgi:uncharacterized protein YvpB
MRRTPELTAGLATVVMAGIFACGAPAATMAGAGTPTPSTVAAASPSAAPVASPSPRPTSRVLDIQIHHQEHRLSCEAAALQMALSYFGVAADELTLIGYMTRDPRRGQVDAHGRLVAWGDPAQGFVGDPDGRLEIYTGYGVYYGPVAKAAVLARVHVVAAGSGLYESGIAPAELYDAVLDGHPAVAWISNTYHQVPLATYTAYDGATVSYTLTEHAVTVIGVRPDAVLINDPWFGQAWHPKAQFESAYATFKQMAVVLAA